MTNTRTGSESETGFNRYMVECELTNVIGLVYDRFGFNRYMVECEY